MKRVGAPLAWISPRISTRKNPMGGILRKESRHMPIEAYLALPNYAMKNLRLMATDAYKLQ